MIKVDFFDKINDCCCNNALSYQYTVNKADLCNVSNIKYFTAVFEYTNLISFSIIYTA